MYDILQQDGLSIDHADSNIYNNTIYNLSIMERVTNARKGSITSRVKLPNSLVVAYVDGSYRVEFQSKVKVADSVIALLQGACPNIEGIQRSGIQCYIRFLCNTAEDLADCLRYITMLNIEGCDPVRDGRNWLNQDNNAYSKDTKAGILQQERLAALPVELFQKWNNRGVDVESA